MIRTLILSLMVLCFFSNRVSASSAQASPYQWTQTYQASSPEGVSTFVSKVPGLKIKAFKGVSTLPYPVYQVLEALNDVEHFKHWIYRCIESDIDIPADNDATTLYIAFSGFWFIKDRDVDLRLRTWKTENGNVHLHAQSFERGFPIYNNRVRMTHLDNRWKLIEKGPGKTEVHFETAIDLSGSVPVWVANIIHTDAPKRTLKRLKKLLDSGRYQASSFETINYLDERFRISSGSNPIINDQN